MVYVKSDKSIRKLHATMIAKHGSLEAWKECMRERASKGGKLGGGKGGFAVDKDLARRAGRLGGLKSRKTKL